MFDWGRSSTKPGEETWQCKSSRRHNSFPSPRDQPWSSPLLSPEHPKEPGGGAAVPRDSCSPTGHRLNDHTAEVQREAGDAALCPQSVLKRRQKCLTIICAAKPCLGCEVSPQILCPCPPRDNPQVSGTSRDRDLPWASQHEFPSSLQVQGMLLSLPAPAV